MSRCCCLTLMMMMMYDVNHVNRQHGRPTHKVRTRLAYMQIIIVCAHERSSRASGQTPQRSPSILRGICTLFQHPCDCENIDVLCSPPHTQWQRLLHSKRMGNTDKGIHIPYNCNVCDAAFYFLHHHFEYVHTLSMRALLSRPSKRSNEVFVFVTVRTAIRFLVRSLWVCMCTFPEPYAQACALLCVRCSLNVI